MTEKRFPGMTLALVAILLCPALASANQPDVLRLDHDEGEALVSAVELTLEGGLLDRGTTGVGEPLLGCDDRRLRLSGIIGVTGARADAGMGNGAADDRWNLREVASEQLDHHALGAVLGVALDVHSGPFLLGLMLDVRELFALGDTPVARSFVATGSLRAGVELDL